MQLGEIIESRGDSLCDDRLVGYAPLLYIGDWGAIADPTGLRSTMRLSRLTLRASSLNNATHSETSCIIDRELIMPMQVGDVLRLSHSAMWGTGISLLRGNDLVFAAGAILGHPLGKNIRVKLPDDFSDRWARYGDIPYELRKGQKLLVPVEFHVGNETRSIYGGTAELGAYEFWVREGTDYNFPSGDTIIAIAVKGLSDSIPTVASAMLLHRPKLANPE